MKCLKYKYVLDKNAIEYWIEGEGRSGLYGYNMNLNSNCNTQSVGRIIFKGTTWIGLDKRYDDETIEIVLEDGKVQGFAYYEQNQFNKDKSFSVKYVVTGGNGDFKNAQTITVVFNPDNTRQVCVN
jgi:hypothetical protein